MYMFVCGVHVYVIDRNGFVCVVYMYMFVCVVCMFVCVCVQCSYVALLQTHTSSGPEIPREGAEEPRCGEMPNAFYI